MPASSNKKSTSIQRRSAAGSNNKTQRLRWTKAMEEAMLNAMVKTMKDGHVAETGYKPIVWNAAVQAVREAAHANQVSIKQVKSKNESQKKDWRAWEHLCSQSGWGWDDELQVPIAEEDVMDRYFDAHPEASKFRLRALDF
jgi:hypothetical protein